MSGQDVQKCYNLSSVFVTDSWLFLHVNPNIAQGSATINLNDFSTVPVFSTHLSTWHIFTAHQLLYFFTMLMFHIFAVCWLIFNYVTSQWTASPFTRLLKIGNSYWQIVRQVYWPLNHITHLCSSLIIVLNLLTNKYYFLFLLMIKCPTQTYIH